MDKTIIKRDGTKSKYIKEKIENAILSAAKRTDFTNMEKIIIIVDDIHEHIKQLPNAELTINEIQELVEKTLIRYGLENVAREYIEYRTTRDIERSKHTKFMQDVNGIVGGTNKDITNENSNKDSKLISTQRDLLAGVLAEDYAKKYILPKHIVKAHESGDIHYHDLSNSPFQPSVNCCLVDLKNMLKDGFKCGNADIETPKSITVAATVTTQIIAAVASSIYGGTSINRIDEVLAPYVLKSYEKHLKIAEEYNIEDSEKYARERTEKETYDACQVLEYQVNSLYTTNGQTPFITFGFGLGTSWAEKLIQRCILQVRINGLGAEHRTPVFPKLVFGIKKGINFYPSDPNYDIKLLAIECCSKRMYPDILNYDQIVQVTGSYKAPMGCRSFLADYFEHGENISDGRNNLGVVSINLPRCAIEANGNEEQFYKILDKKLKICFDALMTRIERLENVTAKVAPILYMYGAFGVRLKEDDKIIDIFKNGRASISLGYIGIHETIKALYGDYVYNSDDLKQKSIEIIKYLSDKTKEWKNITGYGFSLYGTPAENLCYRFCKLDVTKFGIIEGVTDKGYYTNSFHLDVCKVVTPYEKIDFESCYPQYSSGGFISYVELTSMQKNLEALEKLWNYSYDKVPYMGWNQPIDECYKCGYKGEFEATAKGFKCPECGNTDEDTISVTRRCCGYLSAPTSRGFNKGKQIEVKNRVKHC